MAIAAGRIRLHRRLHQLEHGAEVLHRAGRVRVRRIGAQEAVAAFQRLGGALEALAHQRGGHQTIAGGPADLEALGPGAVGQELQAAGALAQHGAQGAFHPLGAQAEHPGGGGGGTERAAGRGGMEAAVVVLAGGQSQGDAAGDFVAGDDPGQHVGAGRADHLACGERRGDHRRAGMQRAGGVRVVEVERMRQRAVQERGAGRACSAPRRRTRRNCRPPCPWRGPRRGTTACSRRRAGRGRCCRPGPAPGTGHASPPRAAGGRGGCRR